MTPQPIDLQPFDPRPIDPRPIDHQAVQAIEGRFIPTDPNAPASCGVCGRPRPSANADLTDRVRWRYVGPLAISELSREYQAAIAVDPATGGAPLCGTCWRLVGLR